MGRGFWPRLRASAGLRACSHEARGREWELNTVVSWGLSCPYCPELLPISRPCPGFGRHPCPALPLPTPASCSSASLARGPQVGEAGRVAQAGTAQPAPAGTAVAAWGLAHPALLLVTWVFSDSMGPARSF